jgi:pyruvate/2-oxoglutarate/acetoin dehydrogenase E1 component
MKDGQRFIDGLQRALRAEFEHDPLVMILGEDVAVGGPFGVTSGLVDEFGEGRVINTPISEESIMGVAIGAAAAGRRPIIEIMFIDFLTLAMNQLVNHAAKLRYMSGGQLSIPMVIRVQQGAEGGWGSQHSQSLESWFLHVPGLKVYTASNSIDAESMMRAAIQDDDPVMFLEHRGLYFSNDNLILNKIEDPEKARIVRDGSDLTVVSYSRMTRECLNAAAQLAEEGIEAEIIDLRSLQPLDLDTIIESIKKTFRVMIVHEAVMVGGVGAEIAAQIQNLAFDWLDAPVTRVGAPFAPVPASPILEKAYIPNSALILEAARSLVGD